MHCAQQLRVFVCAQATFYSDVDPDCASPSSNTQYALPDFSTLTPDASTPARCIDALDYQVSAAAVYLHTLICLYHEQL